MSHNINSLVLYRLFTTNSYYFYPKKNDEDKLFEKVDSLAEEFNEINKELESLIEEILEEEKFVESGDGTDDSTELSKYVEEWSHLRDESISGIHGDIDDSSINKEREYKSILVDVIAKTNKTDLEHLKEISGHTDISPELIKDLEDQKYKVDKLWEKFHDNDLAPIGASDKASYTQDDSVVASIEQPEDQSSNPQRFKQDSSDVSNDTDMPDIFGADGGD